MNKQLVREQLKKDCKAHTILTAVKQQPSALCLQLQVIGTEVMNDVTQHLRLEQRAPIVLYIITKIRKEETKDRMNREEREETGSAQRNPLMFVMLFTVSVIGSKVCIIAPTTTTNTKKYYRDRDDVPRVEISRRIPTTGTNMAMLSLCSRRIKVGIPLACAMATLDEAMHAVR